MTSARGSVIIEVDEEEIQKEVPLCQFDVIGKIKFQKGDSAYTSMELKAKLTAIWKIQIQDITYLGKGFYHIFLGNMDYQSRVLSMGTLNLKPGFFRVSWWVNDFNPQNLKQKNAQCWIRIYDLPMGYRCIMNLFNIARRVGTPLKLDPRTQRTRPYLRVQVYVDCSKDLPH